MIFSETLWKAGKHLIDEMISHPFNQELAGGTLPKEKFSFYLQQDDLYIREYTKALYSLLGKAPDELARYWIKLFAEDGYELEKALHDVYFKKFKITPATEMSSACADYSGFLISTVEEKEFVYGAVALLPCFWAYYEVGKRLLAKSVEDNPYRLWLDTYLDKTFEEQVRQMIELVDRFTQGLAREKLEDLKQYYLHSCELELSFWNSAYNLDR